MKAIKISGLMLLGTNNAKTVKGFRPGEDETPILTAILYLMPVATICAYAVNCIKHCLVHSGHGGMSKIVADCRIRKTLLYIHAREWFIDQLCKDIEKFITYCDRHGYVAAIRLNGTSDIDWSKYIDFSKYSAIFYDYSKGRIYNRNLHITFSYDASNTAKCKEAIDAGINVAVCFKDKLPTSFLGIPVYNGDRDDLRFLDTERGQICGLVTKRDSRKLHERATNKDNGFIVDIDRNPYVDLKNATQEDLDLYTFQLSQVYPDFKAKRGWVE